MAALAAGSFLVILCAASSAGALSVVEEQYDEHYERRPQRWWTASGVIQEGPLSPLGEEVGEPAAPHRAQRRHRQAAPSPVSLLSLGAGTVTRMNRFGGAVEETARAQRLHEAEHGLHESEARNVLLREQLVAHQKKEEARLAETQHELHRARRSLEASESQSRMLYSRLQNVSQYLRSHQEALHTQAKDEKLRMLQVSDHLRDGKSKIEQLQLQLDQRSEQSRANAERLKAGKLAMDAAVIQRAHLLHELSKSKERGQERLRALQASEARGQQLADLLAAVKRSRLKDQGHLQLLQQQVAQELAEDARRLNASQARVHSLELKLTQERDQAQRAAQASRKLLKSGQEHLRDAAQRLQFAAARDKALERQLEEQARATADAQAKEAEEARRLSATSGELRRVQGLLNRTQAKLAADKLGARPQPARASQAVAPARGSPPLLIGSRAESPEDDPTVSVSLVQKGSAAGRGSLPRQTPSKKSNADWEDAM